MNETGLNKMWTGKLGEALPLKYGKSLPAKLRDARGNVPVFGSSGRVGVHTEALTQGPSLIVGRKGSVGSVYFSNEPCWPIDTAYYTEAVEGQDIRYFKYLLDSLHLKRLDKSTAIPGLSRDDYNALTVAIAPIKEQRKIVAEIEKQFSRLDEAVANLKRVKANLKRYKAAVLKAAVEGRLVPTEAELAKQNGRSYDSREQLLERICSTRLGSRVAARNAGSDSDDVSADLDTLPQGWASATIGEVFDVFVGATPSRAESSYWNGEIPWVSSGEVSFCRIRCTREQITEAGLANSSVRLHPKGTVLLGMIGEGKTRGQAAILDIEAGNNQNAAAIRVSETDVFPEYVYYFFEKEYEATRRRGSGGNQPALNKARVQSVSFPIPPVAEQQRIVAEIEYRFSLIRGVAEQVDVNLRRSERMRQSFLALAFGQPKKRNHEEMAA